MLRRRCSNTVGTGWRTQDAGRNGVAILARHPIEESARRVTSATSISTANSLGELLVNAGSARLRVASVHVPHDRAIDHGHYRYKVSFLDTLTERARRWLRDDPHVVIAGDLNDVIATDIAFAARLDTTWIDHAERGAEVHPTTPRSSATSGCSGRDRRVGGR